MRAAAPSVAGASAEPRASAGAMRPWADLVYRRLRLKNPWSYKAPLLIAFPYFVIAATALPADAALLGIAASVCTIAGIAGLAYFLNDLGDVDKDRLAGRDNAVAGMGHAQRGLLLALFAAAALGPWLYLPLTWLTGGLLAAELALFAAYAFPPLRLKERGALGVVADATYAHALPAVLSVLTFSLMPGPREARLLPLLVALAAWQLALGMRNIALHQIQDHDRDRLSGTRTLATDIGPARTHELLRRVLVPLEVATYAAFAAVASLHMPLFVPAHLAYLAVTAVRIGKGLRRPAPADLRGRLYAYLDDYYADWLPLVVLAYLVAAVPAAWPLVPLHLLLFRSGVRPWLSKWTARIPFPWPNARGER